MYMTQMLNEPWNHGDSEAAQVLAKSTETEAESKAQAEKAIQRHVNAMAGDKDRNQHESEKNRRLAMAGINAGCRTGKTETAPISQSALDLAADSLDKYFKTKPDIAVRASKVARLFGLSLDQATQCVLDSEGDAVMRRLRADYLQRKRSESGHLYIHTANAGVVTANSPPADLVVENSAPSGISILLPLEVD